METNTPDEIENIENIGQGKKKRNKKNRQKRKENEKRREAAEIEEKEAAEKKEKEEKEKKEKEEREKKEKEEKEKKEKEALEKKTENLMKLDNNDKNVENNNNEKKEENIVPSKVIESESNMLLYINPISKYLIKFLKTHDMSLYTGLKTKNGLVGLTNMGNTCYMNSALQCLSNCEYLTKYFLSGYYKRDINLTSKFGTKGKIAESYYQLLTKLWKETNEEIEPLEFYKTFVSHAKSFNNSSQHDSHEMLLILLEKLHEDLNRNKEKVYIELSEKGENEDDIMACNRWWETHQKRDNSIIMDLFSGQYKSTLRCPFCDRVSITYDQFSCLELPIENKCFFGTCYIINDKENKIRKINLIFGEVEKFKDICDKINCQKNYKAILCRSNKMYLACLKNEHNLYEIISMSHKEKKDLKDRIIFYEYENGVLDNKLIFFVVPVFAEDNEKVVFFPKIFYYKENDTIQNFFSDLKTYYHKYYNEKDGNFSDDKIKLRILNNLTACTKTHDPCDYCKSEECVSCEFKFGKNMTMGELQKTQSKKRSFVMYLEIPKKNFENEDVNSIKLYDNYLNDEEDFILNNELSLENCINTFSRCEKLDEQNEWYCSKCKKHRRGYKQLELFRLPRYLILQLKRFKNQIVFFFNSKNSTNVKFPLDNLNLNKYLVGPKNMDYIYDLISVSQHYGASFGGHYTAVCRKENNNWYKFDDESVYRISPSSIVNSEAYILIYKLRE